MASRALSSRVVIDQTTKGETLKTTICKRLEWDSAHRVMRHESKCSTLHGHRYAAEITCEADELDLVGRVVDFGVVKERVGAWIDEHWDHTTLVNNEDVGLKNFVEMEQAFGKRAPYVFQGEPTAENIARALFRQAQHMIDSGSLRVVRVRVYETPTSYAEVNA